MSIALITGSCGLVGSESAFFFAKKGFKIIGIDNNSRRFFFGKDGDVSRVKNNLKKELKNYNHFNVDIRNKELNLRIDELISQFFPEVFSPFS